MWYAAHLVYLHQRKGINGGEVIAEESVILISASTREKAQEKAEHEGRRIVKDSQISYWHPEPAEVLFGGVYDVVDISNPDLGNQKRPSDKSEITYRIFRFISLSDYNEFLNGKKISAKIWQPPDD
jgi:hypothetical protein